MQTQKWSSSPTVSDLENDTDRSLSPVDQWENEDDDVILLQKEASNIAPFLYPKEYEGLAAKPLVNASAEFPSCKRASELSTSTNRSQKNWTRTRSNQSGKKCNKSKKSIPKKENEIQFECFLEDDENSCPHSYSPSLSRSPITTNKSSIPTRGKKSVQSWLTQTLQAVKKGCVTRVNQQNGKPLKQHGRNTTKATGDCDDESQVQITFERTDIERNKSYIFGHSIHDDLIATFSEEQILSGEPPIQFFIPNDVVEPVYSLDYDESSYLIYGDPHTAIIGTKLPVALEPLV